MTVSDLIAELQKLPPHLPVYSALDGDDYELCDVNGDHCTVNLTRELDCYPVTYVRYEGTSVELVAEIPSVYTPYAEVFPLHKESA